MPLCASHWISQGELIHVADQERFACFYVVIYTSGLYQEFKTVEDWRGLLF